MPPAARRQPLAIRFLKNYLNAIPNAPNREDVRTLIATLEKEIEQASKAGPPQGTIAPPEVAEPAEPQSRAQPHAPSALLPTSPTPERRRVRPWVWGVVAGGVIVVGLAVGLGVGLTVNRPQLPAPFSTIEAN